MTLQEPERCQFALFFNDIQDVLRSKGTDEFVFQVLVADVEPKFRQRPGTDARTAQRLAMPGDSPASHKPRSLWSAPLGP